MAVKTHPTDVPVGAFLDAVPNARRRRDGWRMHDLLVQITGETPVMWGPTMVGFGSAPITNTTGTNDWFLLGFSPRAASLTIYGLADVLDASRFEALGPHKLSTACLYITDLDKVDRALLEELLREAWAQATSAVAP